MSGWKSIFLQVVITTAAVWIVLNFLGSSDVEQRKALQNVLFEQTQLIDEKLNTIENRIDGKQAEVSINPGPSPRLMKNPEEINKNLTSIIERLVRLESRVGGLGARIPRGEPVLPNRNIPPQLAGRTDPTAWIRELPEAKRNQVEDIFKEMRETMRKKNLDSGQPPSREKMRAMREETNQRLSEALKEVLDENEYRKFLESLPKPPQNMPPALPGSP